ncbi:hypothetical protein CWO91_00045 [Bradyrhizobium genosp. SA-3]|uniref:hypothetical protein n=1 Tax=Bradyrhizobium genosp. SA-3 TaxID=508868 RepID=UPI001029002D|nr:hypothetical protein [Bradyrhizobium genosp. SA-3]RZN13266.1 hypothetical protein CWO91_00045 [Bradyrhizobium genosp. SA-3]
MDHRTIGTTLNALVRSGFSIELVDEFALSTEQIKEIPALAEELERPRRLLVSSRRSGADPAN